MSVNRRIFVSAPRDIRLDEKRISIKRAIVDQIEQLGYEPQIFLDPGGGRGLAAGVGWNLGEVERVATRCIGAALIGLPFWKISSTGRELWLPTDYCQYEGAVARANRLPILAVAIGIEQRIIFHEHAPLNIISIPLDMDSSWLQTEQFRGPFENWKHQLEMRRDLFLGYCSSSNRTAQKLKSYLEEDLGATVLDWQTDFSPGSTILEEIEEATSRCSAGVFLFTKDDSLTDNDDEDKAVPRDNVVFEAGYFSSVKGQDRVLIIREDGTKMPADLGGQIYVSMSDKSDIGPIKDRVRMFVKSL